MRVPVACIVQWSTGTTGMLECTAGGPEKDRVTVDKTTFRLERICTNDKRVSSYAVDGGNMPIDSKPMGKFHCADFGGVQQLPVSCSCVAPPGGDCAPPAKGFSCLASGYVPLR
jgi:hypothetical protein